MSGRGALNPDYARNTCYDRGYGVLPGVLGSRPSRRTDTYASGPSPAVPRDGCPMPRPSPLSRDGVSCIMRVNASEGVRCGPSIPRRLCRCPLRPRPAVVTTKFYHPMCPPSFRGPPQGGFGRSCRLQSSRSSCQEPRARYPCRWSRSPWVDHPSCWPCPLQSARSGRLRHPSRWPFPCQECWAWRPCWFPVPVHGYPITLPAPAHDTPATASTAAAAKMPSSKLRALISLLLLVGVISLDVRGEEKVYVAVSGARESERAPKGRPSSLQKTSKNPGLSPPCSPCRSSWRRRCRRHWPCRLRPWCPPGAGAAS